jgi:hypothetical protein
MAAGKQGGSGTRNRSAAALATLGLCLALTLEASAAQAVVVTIDGIRFDVTIQASSFHGANPYMQPWWIKPTTAKRFRDAVADQLSPAGTYPDVSGRQVSYSAPLFAWDYLSISNPFSSRSWASYEQFGQAYTGQIDVYSSSYTPGIPPSIRGGEAIVPWAVATWLPPAPPPRVPGPLPLGGLASTFSLSRRLKRRQRRRRPAAWAGGLLGALSGATLAAPDAAAAAAPTYLERVLVKGLQNPRGLSLDGPRLLVSEAGAGGPRDATGSNCIQAGSGSQICSGFSGSIGVWDRLSQTYSRPLTGLPSLAQADGSEGTGIADLTPGGPTGLLGVFGLGGDPGQATIGGLGSDLFGQVVSIDLQSGQIQPRANLAAYERQHNPDGGATPNSNPYALALLGDRLYATDAGGNTLLGLDPSPDPATGAFAILGAFVFPKIPVTPPPFLPQLPNPYPAEPVPTGLAVGPGGQQLQIGEFSGFPFAPGSASVFASDGRYLPQPSLEGFSSITDIASGADGSLYVLEYASNFFRPANSGSIWRVAPDGSREQLIRGLTQPTGLAVADDGTLFVTNDADSLDGELREYRPRVPAPLPLLGAGAAWHQARQLRRRAASRQSH